MMLTSIMADGGVIPLNVLANPIVHAAEESEQLDLSSSLQKLDGLAKLIQLHVNQANREPNAQLVEIPALHSNQENLKRNMLEWSKNSYPQLAKLESVSKSFVDTCNQYLPTLQNFVWGTDKEVTAEAFTARLDSLQSNIAGNKGKLQTYLNELEKLKADVASNIKNLDENVKEGQLLLNGKDGKNSKIAKIKEDLQAAHATIDKDLELIALAPGALNTAGWELFKDLYAFSKDIIAPVAKAAIERAAKGQEAEKNVQDAVDKAEKEAKEKNKDISAEDLEKATKEAREKAEKENEKDLKDYKDLLLEAFPFAKATDQATLKKLFDEFGKLNTLTVAEMKSVQDLPVQNQKIYDLTKQLTVIESQQAQMLLLQNEMQQFTQKLDTEIVLMKEYKKDWDLMSTSITKLAAAKTDEEKNTALDRFAKLSKQLGKQVQQLDH